VSVGACSREYRFHDILGGDGAVRDTFRVQATTVRDLPLEDGVGGRVPFHGGPNVIAVSWAP